MLPPFSTVAEPALGLLAPLSGFLAPRRINQRKNGEKRRKMGEKRRLKTVRPYRYECNYGVPLIDFDRLFGTWRDYGE